MTNFGNRLQHAYLVRKIVFVKIGIIISKSNEDNLQRNELISAQIAMINRILMQIQLKHKIL